MSDFTQDEQWAKEFLSDAENKLIGRMASPVPEEDIAVFHHYLSKAEGPYFEVGVLWAGSLVIAGLSMPTAELYGIDPFWGYCEPGKIDPYVKEGLGQGLVPTREVAEQNVDTYGLSDRTTLITGTHPPCPIDKTFGAVFIDGDHQTRSVLNDWDELKHKVDGIVIFHDLHHSSTVLPAWQKIKKDPMVQEVVYEGGRGKYSRMGIVRVGE